MPEVQIRPAERSDLPDLVKMSHAYQSQYVWQMERKIEEGQIVINFRQMRLPRPANVDYAGRHPLLNEENWSRYQAVLVATLAHVPAGYIGLSDQMSPATVWVTDCVVREAMRRHGIGTALLLSAQDWGAANGCRRIMLEINAKNYPGIQLARKLNYEFCGYNDQYAANQDIVLFFARSLR